MTVAIDASSFFDFHCTHANTNTSDLGDDGVEFRYILLHLQYRCERTVGKICAVFKDLFFSVVVVILTLAFIYQSIIADGRFANLNKK